MYTLGCRYIGTRWVPEVNGRRFGRIITPKGGVIRLPVREAWTKYRGSYPALDTGVDSLMYRHMVVH